MFKEKITEIIKQVEEILKDKENALKMPQNTYFFNDGSVLCLERENGESRYPYSCGGYTLWAHSTGHLTAKDGMFNVFKPLIDTSQPSVAFFAGVDMGDGTYFPISITDAAKQLFEPFSVNRFLVYKQSAAYYVADTEFATFALRAAMISENDISLSIEVINKQEKPLDICFTSYFDALLRNNETDNMWSVHQRKVFYKRNGSFLLYRTGENHAMCINRLVTGAKIKKESHTTSRSGFLGKSRGAVCEAKALKFGEFSDTLYEYGQIASEILKLNINDCARIDYVLTVSKSCEDMEGLTSIAVNPKEIDIRVDDIEKLEKERFNGFNVEFNDIEVNDIPVGVFNGFTNTIKKQVNICAMGDYYVGELLGIRDVFQQLESALHWDSDGAKEKMLRALGFIDPSGRAPRQFSIPKNKEQTPKMDLREFVDQGNWIISCFYSYLAFTGDYSILDENVGYYEIVNDEYVKLSDKSDSALCHIIKIADYLVSNLDREDKTNCLRILFGDWNDAVDGLGKTNDNDKKFGTGVSVMASLHLYRNLGEMIEIFGKVGGYEDKVKVYEKVQGELAEGLVKYAVVENENGEKRLIHGWGDHRSCKIGSFEDSDGKSRLSFAPNAFWASSGLITKTPELKPVIIKALHDLESRFGIKTLTPAFMPDAPGVGRIATLLPGTNENDGVYVHATMFSIMALFLLGDSEYAFKQFKKVLPILNSQITKTPFVMSNAYFDNPEFGYFGQSPIDWHTGSGTLYIKILIRNIMGVNASLDGVIVKPAKVMPTKAIKAEFKIKGCSVKYEYENRNSDKRKIYLNGRSLECCFDNLAECEFAFIPNDLITDGTEIKVCD